MYLALLHCCKASLGQNAATLGGSRPLTASCSYTEIMLAHPQGLAEAICGWLSQPPSPSVAVSADMRLCLGCSPLGWIRLHSVCWSHLCAWIKPSVTPRCLLFAPSQNQHERSRNDLCMEHMSQCLFKSIVTSGPKIQKVISNGWVGCRLSPLRPAPTARPSSGWTVSYD